MTNENAIITGFVDTIEAGVTGLKTVEAASGSIQEVAKQIMRQPAVLVLLAPVDFEAGDESGELLQADVYVDVLVAHKSLQSADDARSGAYDILKSCRDLLNNSDAGIPGTAWQITKQRMTTMGSGTMVFIQRYKGENIHF